MFSLSFSLSLSLSHTLFLFLALFFFLSFFLSLSLFLSFFLSFFLFLPSSGRSPLFGSTMLILTLRLAHLQLEDRLFKESYDARHPSVPLRTARNLKKASDSLKKRGLLPEEVRQVSLTPVVCPLPFIKLCMRILVTSFFWYGDNEGLSSLSGLSQDSANLLLFQDRTTI